MSDKQQFNVYLKPELVKAIKHHAIDKGMSLSALVEEIFHRELGLSADETTKLQGGKTNV
ncbi:CopG family transcriptional regulator [Leucobacter sp. OH1287]|uniref:ribbon-helix-helix domain-containing protein n=1 Tax=Leucobacter sp. OH1287 TaxID=2491049 RepID=UPI000F5DA705|nr:CopG family transcriptional regulator [Leucobacter sp. OH1287]RRD60703.1 CopG family transcriptional regulator [Leucobacter sp. OH1287]